MNAETMQEAGHPPQPGGGELADRLPVEREWVVQLKYRSGAVSRARRVRARSSLEAARAGGAWCKRHMGKAHVVEEVHQNGKGVEK